MSKENKIQQVRELEEKIQHAQAVILTDYRGLNVEQITRLRNQLRELGTEYQVVKNTVFQRAVTGIEENKELLEQFFIGPTAIAFSNNDPSATAKVIKSFSGENKELEIKGALLDKEVLAPQKVIHLASLPSKEILLAQLLAGLQSPITGLVFSLSGIMRKFVLTLEAIRQQKSA